MENRSIGAIGCAVVCRPKLALTLKWQERGAKIKVLGIKVLKCKMIYSMLDFL